MTALAHVGHPSPEFDTRRTRRLDRWELVEPFRARFFPIRGAYPTATAPWVGREPGSGQPFLACAAVHGGHPIPEAQQDHG